jgi:hypothetical protein
MAHCFQMNHNTFSTSIARLGFLTVVLFTLVSCNTVTKEPVMNRQQLAATYFGPDSSWYLDNIPFFECSDKEIEQVYYYRWKLFKAHIRNTGDNSFVITEFINHVAWDRDPYCTINAASMHHIYEGRWLKDDRYMNGYIDYLFRGGGNDRRYSESVADAAFARWLVNGDSLFLMQQLDSMVSGYGQWADHLDSAKKFYYIPAMPDATEYTIASIDASGGKAGFDGGIAFRPTINSYMYANAMAISKIAAMKGNASLSNTFLQKATSLKRNIGKSLWNDSLQHFTDRYKEDNAFVHYWDFIRGRELAGMIPWYFNLPADEKKFNEAWRHVLDTSHLLGKYGMRTNEPSYEYYFKQFVYYMGQRGSQWNGPSWPYQTSQLLTGMANLLNNYKQHDVTNSDYVKLLRLYTRQHFLPDGTLNLVENYDPDLGGPIVYYYWSNHYNHSTYNNLVISGLCGIRPSAGDSLDLHPLVDSSIEYFMLKDVRYHGHKLTLVYDRDGNRYRTGKGLMVFVDGVKASLVKNGNGYRVFIGKTIITPPVKWPVNKALNIAKKNFPVPAASVNTQPDTLYQAIDGRIWYFPEITNYWSTKGSGTAMDWYALDFGKPVALSLLKIFFFADDRNYGVPDGISIEYESKGTWLPVYVSNLKDSLKANTISQINFKQINASRVRIMFAHSSRQVAVSEIEFY